MHALRQRFCRGLCPEPFARCPAAAHALDPVCSHAPACDAPVRTGSATEHETVKMNRRRSTPDGAFIVMPGGLGTLDGLFEAATLIQCQKIGPFPLVLVGAKFWDGLRKWGRFMMKQGVFAQNELGFGRLTDSPAEAVDLILRGLAPAVREHLKPCS